MTAGCGGVEFTDASASAQPPPLSRLMIFLVPEVGMEPLGGWSHEVILAAEPKSVAVAREFVSRHLVGHDLPRLVEDVRLVVSELATNAVKQKQEWRSTHFNFWLTNQVYK